MTQRERLLQYAYLIRLNKPIGTLLLLWPTMWALWLASHGHPSGQQIAIFLMGTFLMRSAGCAMNDYVDRDIDRHVKRTHLRPLTAGKISGRETLIITGILVILAFGLVIQLNLLTIKLSILALCLAIFYPFTKRFFSIPQAVLGLAFGFGIPMAYASELNVVPWEAWLMLVANVFWAIAYDTAYAMVDREDDRKIGIKTSAITFGAHEVRAIVFCYVMFLGIMAYLAVHENLNYGFWLGWIGAVACAIYHYTLVRTRDPIKCFAAFNHNHWLGTSLFVGILLAYKL